MTIEEVLQRANDYCNERSYDGETLTDEFKNKFADFFVKRHPDAGIDDEGIMDEIKFNLDTAKSAVAKGIASKQTLYESKENDYKKQIEALNKKLKSQQPPTPPTPPTVEIPQEVKDKLEKLEQFEVEKRKQDKFNNILALAKANCRKDLHPSLESYAKDFVVDLEEKDEEQAKKLNARFQEMFKGIVGDIKPLAPQQTQKRDEEYLANLPKVKVI